jgi:hypothetical protein
LNAVSGVESGLAMEIILNLAWGLCSLGLIWFWIRTRDANPVGRKTQILALAVVVLLLLPVISLSDDLMAMQGPAETDGCLRRALHSDAGHPSVVPASMALPEQMMTARALSGFSGEAVQSYGVTPPAPVLTRALDSRPPPTV